MENCRKAAVAGQFYESDPEKLRAFIESESAKLHTTGMNGPCFVRAMILPHAGYMFSGKTAIRTVNTAKGESYKRIVLLAPTHRMPLTGAALADYSAYETPLGAVELDREAIEEISGTAAGIEILNQAHEHEHSLEVQLPILQTYFPGAKIVPVICGHISDAAVGTVSEALHSLWNKDTLFVASSDFTHYGQSFNYLPFTENIEENLKKLDMGAIYKILESNTAKFTEYLEATGATICGREPIRLLLSILNRVKEQDGEKIKTHLVEYTTSGKMTGDYSHCVSYAGIIFYE